MSAQTKAPAKKSFQVPHILVIILGLILFACLLTYVAPAGTYQVDEDGRVLAGTFSYIENNTPVPPLDSAADDSGGRDQRRQCHLNDAGSGWRHCRGHLHRLF